MPSYTVYCSRVDAKSFGWASMIPLSHLSFCRRNSVGSGEGAKAAKHDMNLISELKFL